MQTGRARPPRRCRHLPRTRTLVQTQRARPDGAACSGSARQAACHPVYVSFVVGFCCPGCQHARFKMAVWQQMGWFTSVFQELLCGYGACGRTIPILYVEKNSVESNLRMRRYNKEGLRASLSGY